MAVALVNYAGNEVDPRDHLRQVISEAAKAHGKAERHAEAVRRARDMVVAAEQSLSVTGGALEAARTVRAEGLAHAAATGTAPKVDGALRAARAAQENAEDELEAAQAALSSLEMDGRELRESKSGLDDAIVRAVAAVMETTAGRILERIRRTQGDLLALEGVFHALTESQLPDQLLPDGQFARPVDPRMGPVAALRDAYFRLDRNAGQERAREVAAAFRKWRAELARSPDVLPPELPA
jgi:hypothetical protein